MQGLQDCDDHQSSQGDHMSNITQHLAEIDRDGYTIVTNVFDASRAQAIIDRLVELESEMCISPSDNTFEGTSTLRIYNLLAHGTLFEEIATEPRVLSIIDHVLGVDCLVSSASSIAIGPGETSQPIHADDQVIQLAKPHQPIICNSMWAITDFTEANGATRIVPGSHLADSSPDYGSEPDSIPAEMPMGSVLVWPGSLWHGGGANTTDERRYGIAMNYCAGYIRAQENQQLGVPLETINEFEPRLRELCGFGTYRGLIGHVNKKTAAERFLGNPPAEMLWDAT